MIHHIKRGNRVKNGTLLISCICGFNRSVIGGTDKQIKRQGSYIRNTHLRGFDLNPDVLKGKNVSLGRYDKMMEVLA